VRVVIAEDQVLMREGLRLVLERAGFTVAAVAEDARDLVRRTRGLRPDLVVADIRMPPTYTDDGLRAVLELRGERPDLPVMVLSQHVQREYATELVETAQRSVGYLLKQRIADLDTFIADLHRVLAGDVVLDPVVVEAMIDLPRVGDPLAGLTPRQREVLALMAEGRSNASIAEQLGVAEKTVVRHASDLYAELEIHESPEDHRRVLAVVRFLAS
jgi:DNA-binding NarL/FixJ family response regulator